MKKFYKTFLVTPFLFVAASGLTSCKNNNELILRVLNSEDYIYLSESDDPEDLDLTKRFEAYIDANYPEYKGVRVIYDTSDTNETIYSEIQTGKTNYDLINVSEYMAQKIVSGGFANKIDRSKVPNYDAFASTEIKNRLDNIETTIKEYDETLGKNVDKVVKLEDYAVGYMWGTLGILFNPTYSMMEERGISHDEMIEDMMEFSSLWDSKYKNATSIKNSMRDTYALGVMEAFKDEFQELKEKYDSNAITLEEYQKQFSVIFNRCDEESVNKVQESLESLKKNVFGLEVDSGKQDIVTQKIGINLAWSGDATYAIEQAEEVDLELLYSIPELGSNMWSDVWIMPNCERSDAQYELAHLFLDYLCDPDIASLNMSYTGYTSFIGGDSVLELARDWYDIRTDEIYYTVEEDDEETSYQVYAINNVDDYKAVDYDDFLVDRDDSYNDYKLVYFIPYEDDEGSLVEEPADYADLVEHSKAVLLEDGEEQKTYADLTVVNAADSELEEVDLSYFFNGTFYSTAEDKYGDDLANMDLADVVLYQDNVDTIFYSDNYLPYETSDGEQNICVGGEFFCQYPSEETINRCAVMEDYGQNNTYVMKMWENFKSDPLPTWAIVIFVVFLVGIVALISYFVINKLLTARIRKQRKAKEQ